MHFQNILIEPVDLAYHNILGFIMLLFTSSGPHRFNSENLAHIEKFWLRIFLSKDINHVVGNNHGYWIADQ